MREWIYEVKHDGYRMLARFSKDGARLFTRSGNDWTKKLPHLVKALEKLKLKDSWLPERSVARGAERRGRVPHLGRGGARHQAPGPLHDGPRPGRGPAVEEAGGRHALNKETA